MLETPSLRALDGYNILAATVVRYGYEIGIKEPARCRQSPNRSDRVPLLPGVFIQNLPGGGGRFFVEMHR